MTNPPSATRPSQVQPIQPTHLTRAHALARRLLGCHHLAADAVQEALVARAGQADPPADEAAWLLRAVTLRCRHLRRTAARRRHHEHAASQDCALHRGCDNPLHIAIAHELGERLAAALETLPSPQRDALRLYEQSGLDYTGIASRLGLPVGTVRSRLHRARETVRAALHGRAG